jgi:hypothetical protein
MKIQNALDVV